MIRVRVRVWGGVIGFTLAFVTGAVADPRGGGATGAPPTIGSSFCFFQSIFFKYQNA